MDYSLTMRKGFLVFILLVVLSLTSSAYYVQSRWAYAVGLSGHEMIGLLLIVLFVLLQFAGPYLYRKHPKTIGKSFMLHWISYSSLGAISCVLFYTLLADTILLIVSSFRHGIETWAFIIVAALIVVSVAVGTYQAVGGPRLYRVKVPLARLPLEFNGFSIVQISDLHVGPLIKKKYVQKIVNQINEISPDLVALTGDMVDGRVEHLREEFEPFKKLAPKEGIFFVTGNHEYYWRAREWEEVFRGLGVKVLSNSFHAIKRKGSEIIIAGVPDPTISRGSDEISSPEKSVEGASKESCKILLAHQPAMYKDALRAGFDLQLSGHTHGGQFIPWNIFVRLVQPFIKGLSKFKGMWIYVSRGTGYWGPPLRFGVPSELTLITLVKAS